MRGSAPELPRTLQTERLLLRPFEFGDVEAVFSYASDEEWARYLPVPQPYLHEHAEEFVARQRLKDWAVQPGWALILGSEVVGCVDVTFEFEHGRASLGYSLSRPVWGQGLMTESVRAVVGQAFEVHSDLNRVQAWADERNVASRRVLEKVGMKLEGILRDHSVVRSDVISDAWYAVLRSEWGC